MKFQENVLLAKHSNYKIGGPARYFFEAKNLRELKWAIEEGKKKRLPIFILGGGTNILFNDGGFNGFVIKMAINFIKQKKNKITVGAGTPVSEVLDFCVKNKISGLEWAGGLPGLMGGAIRGNAGAFGGEIKDSILEVTSLGYLNRPKLIKRSAKQCAFGYRSSLFKKNETEIILEASFKLSPGNKKEIAKLIQEKISYRKNRHPMEYPSIGSMFENVPVSQISADQNADKRGWAIKKSETGEIISVYLRKDPRISAPVKTDPFPVIPAAHLISQANIKGIASGGAMISPKHPNFIVNVLNAESKDVKNLLQLVKGEVYKKHGIKLEEEIIIM